MHELFKTWKQPVPSTGQPLFAHETLRRIESYLTKAMSAVLEIQQQHQQARPPSFRSTPPLGQTGPGQEPSRSYPASSASVPASMAPSTSAGGYDSYFQAPDTGSGYKSYAEVKPASAITKASLTADLSMLIELTREKIEDHPADVDAATQLSALTQLYQIVSTSELSGSQLQTIKTELDVLANDLGRYKSNKRKAHPDHSILSPPSKRAWNSPQLDQQVPVWTPPVATQPVYASTPPPAVNSLSIAGLQPDLLAQLLIPQMPQQQQQPQYVNNSALTAALAGIPGLVLPVQQSRQVSANDAAALLASLMSAGLINTGLSKPENKMLEKLMGSDVELSNKFIQKYAFVALNYNKVLLTHFYRPRSDLVVLLYDSLPLLCSTCGRRFADTERDRKVRDAHLDWHFRVNKRLRDDSRGQSRSWYLGEEAWIQSADADADVNPDDINDGKDKAGTDGGDVNNAELAKKMQEVSQRYISTPKDAAVVNTPCPICMEKFKSVWNEKAEDWVWMNAVQNSNGKIYHGTCALECGLI